MTQKANNSRAWQRHAIAVATSTLVLTLAGMNTAYAQSNATGTVYGSVQPGTSVSIVVENSETGFKRTLSPDAGGKFASGALPTGVYKATLMRDGKVAGVSQSFEVVLGKGAEIIFASAQSVQVVGRRQVIDIKDTNSGVTFTARQLDALPIAPSMSAVIQLSPNATRGDTRYGGVNAPSIGGASASENSYYINGYPVTNIFFQVGYSQLPFGAIQQASVMAGGYGAEFGRSIGGVVNVTTKSGGNQWEGGFQVSYDPPGLRGKGRNNTYDQTGRFVNTDGKVLFYNEQDRTERTSVGAYVGGPLIKDKLFFFFAGDHTKTEQERTRLASNDPGAATAGWESRALTNPRYMAKVDWNLTDNNRFEFTRIGDEYKDHRVYSGFNYSTLTRNNVAVGGADYTNWGPTAVAAPQGATVDLLKFTSYLTDDLTATALLGRSKTIHVQNPSGYVPGLFQVTAAVENRAPGLTYINPQSASGTLERPGANDKQDGFRFDLEYRAGKHTIRGGIDYIKQKSIAGEELAGGGQWVYLKGDPAIAVADGAGSPASGGGLGAQGYYVEKDLQNNAEQPRVIQAAQYIEDRWQVTDRLLLSLGFRNEQFTNQNGKGEAYIRQMKQPEPRIGLAWDLNGDSSTKLSANAGRYHLQIPTSIALRGAGASLNTQQFFTYTGIDAATGAPTGLNQISPALSGNGEFGVPRDARTVSDKNLKAMFQDELSLGIEQALNKELTVGGKFTYRQLGTTIDDWCDDRPFQKWAVANGKGIGGLKGDCFLINPGRGASLQYDVDGDGKLETVNLTAADIGLEKAKRKYVALDFFAEHPFDGKWYGRVNYTWSRSSGNTEGQLLSDLGQADVGATQTWDYPEFSRNANGLLPNNRTHQIKAYGLYQVTQEWGVGANLLIASGRPKNCKGVNPTEKDPDGSLKPYFGAYTSPMFYCFGAPTSRGSLGNLPWDRRLDVNLIYKPEAIKGLTLRADVFNALNSQVAEVVEERYYTRTGVLRSVMNRVISYTPPVSVRFTAGYNYKF